MSRLSLLVDLAAILPRQIDLDSLLSAAAHRISEALGSERATIWIIDAEEGGLVSQVAILPEVERLVQPLGEGISGHVAQSGESLLIADVQQDTRFDSRADETTGYVTKNMLAVPIREDASAPVHGVLQVLNKNSGAFSDDDLEYLSTLGQQLDRVLALTTLRADDDKSSGLILRGRFNNIVGRSDGMTAVYERVTLAAGTDASVLLTGDTGTGKSIIARAIHDNSSRVAQPFVVVDATTLPHQLIESELFGHERGAFTGADRRVLGKVEQARGGTLFIDELGDLPLESQGKLLRLFQEKEFTRVGGREIIAADVRIVCATHRNLENFVAAGRFRQDLLYRVKVVTIHIPPLKERGETEIALLVDHFARIYATRYGRALPRLSEHLLNALSAHPWPGNVRELEHWVESCVVLHPEEKWNVELAPDLPSEVDERPTLTSAITQEHHAITLPLGLSLDEAIAHIARHTLGDVGGNRTEAARRLRIGRNRLARIIDSSNAS